MRKATIIISFYKKIEYLKLVIAGLEIQTEKEFEVIIADDGSPEVIIDIYSNLLNESKLKWKKVWHEDNGWQKNKILNKAVEAASSDYLIFIDGDCVPHPNFIAEHIRYSRKGICLTGRRVNLSEKMTKRTTEANIKWGYLQKHFGDIVLDGIFGKSFDVEKGIYFQSELIRHFFNKKERGVLGCNFSLFKEDIIEINGFDERYNGPSIGEDSDIEYRLRLNNVNIKSLNNIAVQYHLYHKVLPRPQENLDLFEEIKSEKKFFTDYGIKKINNQ